MIIKRANIHTEKVVLLKTVKIFVDMLQIRWIPTNQTNKQTLWLTKWVREQQVTFSLTSLDPWLPPHPLPCSCPHGSSWRLIEQQLRVGLLHMLVIRRWTSCSYVIIYILPNERVQNRSVVTGNRGSALGFTQGSAGWETSCRSFERHNKSQPAHLKFISDNIFALFLSKSVWGGRTTTPDENVLQGRNMLVFNLKVPHTEIKVPLLMTSVWKMWRVLFLSCYSPATAPRSHILIHGLFRGCCAAFSC